jgi:serine-protein kinase ATM
MAIYATPFELLGLLLRCTNGRDNLRLTDRRVISSSIFRAAFDKARNAQLANFLVRRQIPAQVQIEPLPDLSNTIGREQSPREPNNDRAILEMLFLKLKDFREAWETLSKERASNISADVIQVTVSLIAVSSTLPTILNIQRTRFCEELIHLTHEVWKTVSNFLEHSVDLGSASASAAASVVTSVQCSDVEIYEDPLLKSLSFMIPPILMLLRRENDSADRHDSNSMDVDDFEDSFMSHSSQSASEQALKLRNRQDLPFDTDQISFVRHMMLDLHMSCDGTRGESTPATKSPGPVIDYLIDLRPEDLIASRLSIFEISPQWAKFPRLEACRLLEHVAAACIQNYEFERCEASLCLCIDVLTALSELWTVKVDDELHGVASDLYNWFVEVLLGKGLASPRVLIRLATLLEKVLHLNPAYNSGVTPSSRTSLFLILQRGSNVVKFHVAEKISQIFDRFILTEHNAILGDVIDSLPNDAAESDGIALRLYVLAELASRWPTLLRRCVYHLFETPAHIPSCVPHAQICLCKISSTLQLASPGELFRLFAPQILYTWLDCETLESIPFAIYGFKDLKQLIDDVRDEVVSQIVMRGDRGLADRLSKITNQSFETLLERSFAQAEAYSVARDISMPPAQDNDVKSTESLVRKQLGTDRYLRLVAESFPHIVAILFRSLTDEHEIDRALAKRSAFSSASSILQSITQFSASKIVLPLSQQPSFRTKYLLDELDFLCQRIGKDYMDMWTPPLVVHVSRSLLDSMIPALGSLHACSVLRKIRIVVTLAGPNALQGYVLEMLLQALQPLLTRFYCAEDALGLFRYLLSEGRSHLQQHSSFLCGIAVTTMLSLSAFLASPQDSTTQESHFASTLSGAASFRTWLGEYLDRIMPLNRSEEEKQTFKQMVEYSQEARPPGRPNNDSAEGKLLLKLLEDRSSIRPMLSTPAFKRAVQILCSNFAPAPSPGDDILGSDSAAGYYAPVLWDLIDDIGAAHEFWIWSSEILGRAYAANGVVNNTLTREHPEDLFYPATDGSDQASGGRILEHLRDMVDNDDQVAVSLAERTLQQIVTNLAKKGILKEYDSCLDLVLIDALNWQSSTGLRENVLGTQIPAVDEAEAKNPSASEANWPSAFTMFLCTLIIKNPLLNALSIILSRLPPLVGRIMPFIVHIVLYADEMNGQPIRQTISQSFRDVLLETDSSTENNRRLVLRTLLYLRCQPLRKENTMADRCAWLEVDLGLAATIASSCMMYKTALLLFELQVSQQMSHSSRPSRRSSAAKPTDSSDLQRRIYRNLDDPDFFYGLQEEASLDSVMQRFSHEGNDFENLSFRSAIFDSGIKTSHLQDPKVVFDALVSANMNGIACAVNSQARPENGHPRSTGLHASLTALNLHQWDLPVIPTESDPSTFLFEAFRVANTSLSFANVSKSVDRGLLWLVRSVVKERKIGSALRRSMSALAALTEVKEGLGSRSSDDLKAQLLKFEKREQWQETEK